MMAACKAEAQKNKWIVTIAIVDDSGAALLLERILFPQRVKEKPG